MTELDFTILDVCDDYLKKIVSTIFENIHNYYIEDDDWVDNQERIEEFVYDCLTEILIITSSEANKKVEIKDIFEFCYSINEKNIPNRIKEYLNEIHLLLRQSYPIIEIENKVISKFDSLLDEASSSIKAMILDN